MKVERGNEQYDSVGAWQKLHARLEADNLLNAETSPRLMVNKSHALLKIAAAVALFLVLAGLSVFYFNSPQMVQVASNGLQTTKITTLPDGTSVFLASGSSIEYPKNFRGKTRPVKLQGEAFFDVAKNPEKPFIITTSEAVVKVLGTSFNLKVENSQVELGVVEGRVSIELIDEPTSNVVAIAGESVVSNNNKLHKTVAKSFSPKDAIVKMQFQDETMQHIVAAINRIYGSKIVVEGVELQNKTISVMFENDINSIVDVLTQSFGLQKDEMPDGSIILSY